MKYWINKAFFCKGIYGEFNSITYSFNHSLKLGPALEKIRLEQSGMKRPQANKTMPEH